jgi:hypothetical protein
VFVMTVRDQGGGTVLLDCCGRLESRDHVVDVCAFAEGLACRHQAIILDLSRVYEMNVCVADTLIAYGASGEFLERNIRIRGLERASG